MRAGEVRLESLSKQYGRTLALDDVSLAIEPGHMVALLGPSGCGKTTCLRIIAGLVKPTGGDVILSGQRITHKPVERRNMGMVFQNYALFPHMTVSQNVAFGLDMRSVGKGEKTRRVAEALALVKLDRFGDRSPAQLSGGQQQRIALARALIIEPALLLLDEPLGALDKALREDMQVELKALQRKLGITTVMVTHDQGEALTMADRIVVMRNGRLEQVGSAADIYQRPQSRFVATFVGASNLFAGTVSRHEGAACLVQVQAGFSLLAQYGPPVGASVTVLVRPEAVNLRPAGGGGLDEPNRFAARIEQVIYHGFMTHYHMRSSDGQDVLAFRQNRSGDDSLIFAVGDQVIASWDIASTHILPHD